jgi:hypothetical protein
MLSMHTPRQIDLLFPYILSILNAIALSIGLKGFCAKQIGYPPAPLDLINVSPESEI